MQTNTLPKSDQIATARHPLKQNKVDRYDRVYKLLHWLVAGLILLMLLAKFGFASAISQEDKITMLIGHSSIGSILTLFIMMRLIKRFIIRSERPTHNMPSWQKKVSSLVHGALYLCLVMIPLTGYLTASMHQLPVMPFTLIDLSMVSTSGYNQADFALIRGLHESFINLLMALLVLHIGGALFHKFIRKDGVMSSMTPGK